LDTGQAAAASSGISAATQPASLVQIPPNAQKKTGNGNLDDFHRLDHFLVRPSSTTLLNRAARFRRKAAEAGSILPEVRTRSPQKKKGQSDSDYPWSLLVRPAGFEPAAYGFPDYSIAFRPPMQPFLD